MDVRRGLMEGGVANGGGWGQNGEKGAKTKMETASQTNQKRGWGRICTTCMSRDVMKDPLMPMTNTRP